MDSSTAEAPSSTTPSAGMRSPAPTTSMSPSLRAAMGRSTTCSPTSTFAVCGCRASKERTAPEARRLAAASRYFPSSTRVTMMAAASKWVCPRSQSSAATL